MTKQTAAEQAKRSDGPSGTRSHPLWLRLWRGACGVVAVPQDTATSSSDSPRLFERSASGAKSSSAAHPASATTQVAPQHGCGVADSWGVLFAYFLARQKVSRLPGRDPANRLRTGMTFANMHCANHWMQSPWHRTTTATI